MLESTYHSTSNVEAPLTILCHQISTTLTLDPDYVPVRGVRHIHIETDDFDLDQHVDGFLAGSHKVLLILGDSGAGKSLYTQYLMHRLWQCYSSAPVKNPVPLLISLPCLKDPVNKAIEESLQSYGLNPEQIAELKQNQSFIFILDAYDEIRQNKNLYVTNRLSEWNAKILITCRTQYLFTLGHYNSYFMPYQGEKREPWLFEEVYIKPFNQNQIEKYCQQYVQHHKPEWNDWQLYQKHIEEIPGLKKLIQTPFLLKLSVEAMPEVVKMYQLQNEKPSGKQEEQTEKQRLQMTQAKLYDIFVAQWFERQEQKLKAAKQIQEDEDIKPKFWIYAKGLAKELHQRNLTQVVYEASDDLFGEEETENPWQPYFDEHNKQVQLLRNASLLQQVGKNQYTFFHSSLIEYFVTRSVYETAVLNASSNLALQPTPKPEKEGKQEIETVAASRIPKAWLKDHFNQKLITKERGSLQFLADRVEEDESFKQYLFHLIEASKQTEQIQIAAANAITILHVARVLFSGRDFSHCKLRGANLDDAILDSVNLAHADLSEVSLRQAWLRQANLSYAKMEKIEFGEYPYLEFENSIECLALHPTENIMAIGSWNGQDVLLYDGAANRIKYTLPGHKDYVTSVAFSPDGKQVISGSADNTLRVWEVSTGRFLFTLEGHKSVVTSVAVSPDGKHVVSGSWDETVRLWDLSTQRELFPPKKGHEKEVTSVAFSPDGKQVVSGSLDNTLRLWDVSTGVSLATLKGHEDNVESVAFSPVGKQMISGSEDKTLRLWDVSSRKLLATLMGHEDHVESATFSPDGNHVISGSLDKTLRLWDVSTGTLLATLKGHENTVWSVGFSPDGKQVVSGSKDKTLRLWDVSTRALHATLKGNEKAVTSVDFSPNGKQVISGSDDKTLRLWDVSTGRLLVTLKGHENEVKSVAFSPDGKQVASGSEDNTLRLWDVSTGALFATLKGHESYVYSVAFSPDGKQVVSGSNDKTLRLWDVSTGTLLVTLNGHESWVASVAFSPDGKQVVSGGWDKALHLWDVPSGKLLATLQGHGSTVRSIAFSPDGEQVVSGSEDNTLRLWDVHARALHATLKGNEKAVTTVAFSPDGKQVVSGSDDNTLRLWDSHTGQCLAVVRQYAAVNSLSWQSDKLVVGYGDCSVRLWEIKAANSQFLLRWSSHLLPLVVGDSDISQAQGLSPVNQSLLKQRGAHGEPMPFSASIVHNPFAFFSIESSQTVSNNYSVDSSSIILLSKQLPDVTSEGIKGITESESKKTFSDKKQREGEISNMNPDSCSLSSSPQSLVTQIGKNTQPSNQSFPTSVIKGQITQEQLNQVWQRYIALKKKKNLTMQSSETKRAYLQAMSARNDEERYGVLNHYMKNPQNQSRDFCKILKEQFGEQFFDSIQPVQAHSHFGRSLRFRRK